MKCSVLPCHTGANRPSRDILACAVVAKKFIYPPSVSRHCNLSEKLQEDTRIKMPFFFNSDVAKSQESSPDIKAINSQVSLFSMTDHVVL